MTVSRYPFAALDQTVVEALATEGSFTVRQLAREVLKLRDDLKIQPPSGVTAALMSRPNPRAVFEQRLREDLASHGIALAAAELGRVLTSPVWLLTLRLPAGFMNVQAPVAAHADPVAPTVADEIARRVARALLGED